MLITERLSKPATDFEVSREHTKSKIIDQRITLDSLYTCPRCNSYLKLAHGEWEECPKCELEVARFGNSINIRAEVEE